MTKLAFTDKNDGYYEIELKDGEAIPAWAKEFTPTVLVVPDEIVLTYKELRAAAYPSLTEQADMAYWDRRNGTTTLDDAITAVKTKYPKS